MELWQDFKKNLGNIVFGTGWLKFKVTKQQLLSPPRTHSGK